MEMSHSFSHMQALLSKTHLPTVQVFTNHSWRMIGQVLHAAILTGTILLLVLAATIWHMVKCRPSC